MKKKILSLLTAFAMVFGILVAPFTTASAAQPKTETTTVTIHKLEMNTLPNPEADFKLNEKGTARVGKDGKTEYTGAQINQNDLKSYFGEEVKELANVKFYVYEVSKSDYKTMTDAPQNYKTKADVEKIKNAKLIQDKSDSKNAKDYFLTTSKGVDVPGLEDGKYYWFVEDASSFTDDEGRTITDAAAVPFGLALPVYKEDGSRFNDTDKLHVYPKNTLVNRPEIDKNFKYGKDEAKLAGKKEAADGAEETVGAAYKNSDKEKEKVTSELGKKIPYEVKTKIPQNAKYKKLVWDDQMQKGLVYNKDLTITGVDNLLKDTDYKLYETDRGFRLVFQDSGLTKVENAAKDGNVDITLTYSAHLNGTVKPDQVKENNVTLDYSNKPGFENEPTEVNPSENKITVEKSWAADGKTITEADRHVKAVFTLQEKQEDGSWKDVDEHESNYKEGFTHTFDKLDDSKTYRVVESVSGYEPEYQKTTEDGKVVIVNKIDNDNPKTLKPTNPKVVNGGKKFVKTNQEATERLAGAEFYVKNKSNQYLVADKKDAKKVEDAKAALDAAVKAYNDLSAEDQKGQKGTDAKKLVDDKQVEYNNAFVENASAYSWKTLEEYKKELTAAGQDAKNVKDVKDIKNIVVLTSDGQGRFEITGLEYGEYKLEEKTAPKDYAKLNKDIDFTVAKGSYDGKKWDDNDKKFLDEAAEKHIQYNKDNKEGNYGQQIENKKVTIPQTGGIGSLIFIVAGLAIMIGAFVAYKKSQAVEA